MVEAALPTGRQARIVELDGRDDDALLEEVAGEGHGAGGDAADIGVVGAAGDEAGESATDEDAALGPTG